ncbi:MAG: LamG domain-containing protein [Candidatus Promineifilaceae bacterium]
MNINNFISRRFNMRELKWAMIVVALLVLVLVVTGFSPERSQGQVNFPNSFVGDWQAIDSDGSDIRLTIAGPQNGPFRITWTESYFSFCNREAGIGRGTGLLKVGDPYTLEANLTIECFTTGDSTNFDITWIYDPGTDTISSGFITWHRPGQRGAQCLSPAAGMTGWWPGDGNANDIVGGRDGQLQGHATTGSGLVDLAFSLDGDGDFIEVAHNTALNFGSGDFTVDLWVNFNDISGEQVLVEKWIQNIFDGWTLTKLENDVLRLAMEVEGDVLDEIDLDSYPLTLQPGNWYHFAATRNGNVYTLFMNGVNVAQDTYQELDLVSNTSLKFGRRGDGGYYLNGRIDEVELFVGTALSEQEIMALYAAGSAGKCKDGS